MCKDAVKIPPKWRRAKKTAQGKTQMRAERLLNTPDPIDD